MSDEIPGWAVDVALSRVGVDLNQKPTIGWRDRTYARAVEELAKMIAAHEEPPVDPFVAAYHAYADGDLSLDEARTEADKLKVELAKHGLRIVEAQS